MQLQCQGWQWWLLWWRWQTDLTDLGSLSLLQEEGRLFETEEQRGTFYFSSASRVVDIDQESNLCRSVEKPNALLLKRGEGKKDDLLQCITDGRKRKNDWQRVGDRGMDKGSLFLGADQLGLCNLLLSSASERVLKTPFKMQPNSHIQYSTSAFSRTNQSAWALPAQCAMQEGE